MLLDMHGNECGIFINDCLNCVDSRGGGKVPRPFGETTHGTEISSCSHFDYLRIGPGIEKMQHLTQGQVKQGHDASEYLSCEQPGAQDSISKNGTTFPDDADPEYILVMKEDITGLVMLEPASAANVENAAARLQR